MARKIKGKTFLKLVATLLIVTIIFIGFFSIIKAIETVKTVKPQPTNASDIEIWSDDLNGL